MATAQAQVTTRSAARLGATAHALGVPRDSLDRFLAAGYVPQPKQLEFHAAARQCDRADGPVQVGLGGARGPGKSHALLAQIALDDCQRQPQSKWLFLRKVGKAAKESFEDLRLKVLMGVPHKYKANPGMVEFSNGSRIITGHFQNEKDIDNYLGLEYDGVGIEEATQLTAKKKEQIRTCVRTSKPGWRPRAYLSFNPGGVGHASIKAEFIAPWRAHHETDTRFVFATYRDNAFLNPEYVHVLNSLKGWERAAWRDGDWDIAAGQFFSTWRYEIHARKPFAIPRHWPVWGGFDYGFTHPTAFYLLTKFDGLVRVIGEHCERKKLPPHHAAEMRALAARLGLAWSRVEEGGIYAGADVFAQRGDASGQTIADQYKAQAIKLKPAKTDRVSGASEILTLLGDADNEQPPRIEIFSTCTRLIECLPALQHNPHKPEDVLKMDADEEGLYGDDPYDALRYAVMSERKSNKLVSV